ALAPTHRRAPLHRRRPARQPLTIRLTSSSYCTLAAPVVTSRNSVSPAFISSVAQTLELGEQRPSPCGLTSEETRKAAVLPSFSMPRNTSAGSEPADASAVSGARSYVCSDSPALPKLTRSFVPELRCDWPPPEDPPPDGGPTVVFPDGAGDVPLDVDWVVAVEPAVLETAFGTCSWWKGSCR